MGEPIEITTWPKHQNIFYKVTSSAFSFDVKARGNAAIGLATKPGTTCDYWVAIGDNNRCWIKKEDDRQTAVNVDNIITNEEYTSLWISWYSGVIQLGRQGESKPVISAPNKTPDLKYLTFTVLGERNPVDWRFQLPPLLEQPEIKPVTGGTPTWVQAGTQLPPGAIIGGYENEILYIMRAHHRGSLTPGKFVPSEGLGYVSWGGEADDKGDFEVLCGFDCLWVPTCEDKIPVGAVQGGNSEDRYERLYVGRALHNGYMIPGKVQPSHKVCYIPFEGKEIAKKTYEILVDPTSNPRCVNKTFISGIKLDNESNNSSESEPDDDDYPRVGWGDDEGDYYDSNENEDYAF